MRGQETPSKISIAKILCYLASRQASETWLGFDAFEVCVSCPLLTIWSISKRPALVDDQLLGESHGLMGGDVAVWVMGINVEQYQILVSIYRHKYSPLFSAGLLSSPTRTNVKYVTIANTHRHTHMAFGHTWLVKISSLANSQSHKTHQYITHSPLYKLLLFFYSYSFLISLTLFGLRPHVHWQSFEPV